MSFTALVVGFIWLLQSSMYLTFNFNTTIYSLRAIFKHIFLIYKENVYLLWAMKYNNYSSKIIIFQVRLIVVNDGEDLCSTRISVFKEIYYLGIGISY